MSFLVFVLGLVIGSFLNVLIDRIPRGENIVWKPSHCDYCKKPLRWFELIPVLSFLLQAGRCRRCHKALSFQYPGIEIVTGIGFVLLFVLIPQSLPFLLLSAGLFSIGLVIFFIDIKHMIIPDSLLVVLLVLLVFVGISLSPAERFTHVVWGVGSGLGFLALWLITRGRGLGFGDVKLATIIGLTLGYPFTIIALYIAFLTGAGVGVILIMSHRAGMKSRIPFGPFLIIGAASSMVWGTQILAWWYTLL